jgi:hypothetical protein
MTFTPAPGRGMVQVLNTTTGPKQFDMSGANGTGRGNATKSVVTDMPAGTPFTGGLGYTGKNGEPQTSPGGGGGGPSSSWAQQNNFKSLLGE